MEILAYSYGYCHSRKLGVSESHQAKYLQPYITNRKQKRPLFGLCYRVAVEVVGKVCMLYRYMVEIYQWLDLCVKVLGLEEVGHVFGLWWRTVVVIMAVVV
jgi:hypothetical protein